MQRILIEKYGHESFKIETMIEPPAKGMVVPNFNRGVKVTHVPTGLWAESKKERSSGRNMAAAFQIVLFALELDNSPEAQTISMRKK